MSAIRSTLRAFLAFIFSTIIYFLLFFASIYIVSGILSLLLGIEVIAALLAWFVHLFDVYAIDEFAVYGICSGLSAVLSKMFLDWFMRHSPDRPYKICRIPIISIIVLFGIGFAFVENGKYILCAVGLVIPAITFFLSKREFAVPPETTQEIAKSESSPKQSLSPLFKVFLWILVGLLIVSGIVYLTASISYNAGYESGYSSGNTDGYATGYSEGRSEGYKAGILEDEKFAYYQRLYYEYQAAQENQ